MYAKYTEVLKNLLDNEITKELIDIALSKYPLYKPDKVYDLIPTREELNTKLLNHYKYREIGFETVGRFVDELEITMNEIMPYYNERFKTVVTMADLPNPFDNVDVIETYDETRTNTTSGSGTSKTDASGTTETTANSSTTNKVTSTDTGTNNTSGTENNKKVHSDTPQDDLSITAKNINSVEYADSVEWDSKDNTSTTTHDNENESNSSGSSNDSGTSSNESTTESTANSEQTENGTTSHTYTKKGNQGVNTYAHDMNEFRTSIIDVVNEIITDKRIAELFMLVY